MDIKPIHFASPPYASPGALKKEAHDLTEVDKFGGQYPIYRCRFRDQEEIKIKAPAYLMTLTRRFMMRMHRPHSRGSWVVWSLSMVEAGQVASKP